MKIILAFCITLCALPANAQSEQSSNLNLPIIVTIQFHSLAVPFHNLKSNFKNIGIGVGTELDYSNQSKFHQRFTLLYYHNKAVGNGWLLQSQAVWRPTIDAGFGELNAGLGYMISKRPIRSYRFDDGEWVSARKKGKGLLVVPVGIGGGYATDNTKNQMSYFFNYQMMLVSGYNRSIPLVPETLIQFGTSIKSK